MKPVFDITPPSVSAEVYAIFVDGFSRALIRTSLPVTAAKKSTRCRTSAAAALWWIGPQPLTVCREDSPSWRRQGAEG
jgi:hypothetical protein